MRSNRLRVRESLYGIGFISPAFILLIAFGIIPLILAIYISFFDFPLINPARREFVGWANYLNALQNNDFQKAFTNTIYYALLQMPMQTILGLILALLIAKPRKGRNIFWTSYYLPVVMSMVVVSVIWRIMLDSENGLINSVLLWIGLPRQPFLTSVSQAIPSLAVMVTWKWVGFSMLIFLAGLKDIPTEYYDAGKIDGANAFQGFRYITLPLLKRPLAYVLVVNTIAASKFFTPVYVITKGGPSRSTLSVIYYMFQEAFSYGRFGYATAVAVLFLIFMLVLAMVQLRMMRSDQE